MVLKRWIRPILAGSVIILAGAFAPAQRNPALTALGGLERGQWQLRDAEGGVRRMCLGNPAALLQIMHGNAQCEHFVMENTPRGATIRYTCPSHGHGRTSITVDTPRVVNIETQGVANGAPFSEQFEGRRVGACS
jgi:hypothetical protein